MQKFTPFTGVVAPLDRANVDTDAIIPKQFLKSIKRTGFGPYLFDEWRYLDRASPRWTAAAVAQPGVRAERPALPRRDHPAGARELRLRLVARARAWALADYGFRLLIAPSFADIFFNNSFKNGLLPVVLSPAKVDRLFKRATGPEALRIGVDLEAQRLRLPDARRSRSRSTRSASTVCSRGWTTSA